jgi:hypothetical protein
VASRAFGASALDPTLENERRITQPRGSDQFYRKDLTQLAATVSAPPAIGIRAGEGRNGDQEHAEGRQRPSG